MVDTYNRGRVNEVFGMGTAAVISLIEELRYKDVVMKFDTGKFSIARKIKQRLNDIRSGNVQDSHGWMFRIGI